MFEICHSKKCFYFLILERYRKGERVIETNINLLFHLCIHWLLLVCALTGDQTHNLGILGQHSNHLSYPSRAEISHFLKRFYLLIFRGEGRERGRETSMCCCLSCTPHWGPGPQPSHVPWLGIKQVTPWFSVWHSVHWATSTREKFPSF